MTKDRTDSMRWHFVFREEQMKHMAASFYAIVGKNSPTVRSIAKVLEKNSIDKIQLFLRVVEHFFYGYLPFPVSFLLYSLFSEFFFSSSTKESKYFLGYSMWWSAAQKKNSKSPPAYLKPALSSKKNAWNLQEARSTKCLKGPSTWIWKLSWALLC